MSRSYKKSPAISNMNYKDAKKRANKRVRRKLKRSENFVNGKFYKKFYQSWDIRDYSYLAPSFEVFCEHEFERERRFGHPLSPLTEEKLRYLYNKWYKRK